VGVHDPTRLQVLKVCTTFVGTVTKTPRQFADGDFAFWVAPDAAYTSMLNAKNRAKGAIHVEIIPFDLGVRVRPPPLHAHIRITGAHVYDRWNDWNEMHPVWNIEILSGGGPPPPPPPPPPPAPTVAHLKARLTGKAAGKTGAQRGSGSVTLTLTGGTVCWRFTRLARVNRPTGALIRAGAAGRRGPVVLALGSRYRKIGCASAGPGIFKALAAKPRSYYVVVTSARHRRGAIRGQLGGATLMSFQGTELDEAAFER
jgi:CHRD domain